MGPLATLVGLATACGQVTDVPTLVNTQVPNTGVPQTILVLQNPGAGRYTLTNSIVGTNTSTRLASVAHPGFSWDLQGYVYADGTKTGATAPALVKTIVASQFQPYGSTSFTGDNGTNSFYAFTASQRVYLPQNTFGVEPVYVGYHQTASTSPGWTYANGYENPLPNALEVAVSLTDSASRVLPQTFNGNRIARLNPYGWLTADDNIQQYTAGDYVTVQAYVNRLLSNTNTYNNGEVGVLAATGTYMPLYYTKPADSTSGYSAVSAYATGLNTLEAKIDTAGGQGGNYPNTSYGFFPFAFQGYVKAIDNRSVVAIGDSISAGTGDTGDLLNLNSGGGYLYRALWKSNPVLNLGFGGDKANSWGVTNGVNRTAMRMGFLQRYKFPYLYYAEGFNDINAGGRTFAQLTNDVANHIAALYAMTGAKIVLGTIYPQQTSSGGKYYGAGDMTQTYANATNVAPGYNALLRTNPTALGPVWKVFDVAAIMSPDDVNLRYLTNDLYTGTCTTTNGTAFLSSYWRTLIDTNASWTVNQWVGQPVQITNGVAPSWPGNLMVASNSATTLYLFAPPGVTVSLVATNYLTAGATYGIGKGGYVSDGAHPNPWIHALIASNIVSQGIFSN